MRRAAHQLYDDPLVFADLLAMRVLTEDARAELRAREEVERTHPFARGMRAFMCARSRFAEDALECAVAAGVRQYVVPGAGLDTYAGRSALPECSIHPQLRIFEVDHPARQAWKRACLEQAGVQVPDTVTLSPVDFERKELIVKLVASGFDAAAPAFCSWLGVLPLPDTRGCGGNTARAGRSAGGERRSLALRGEPGIAVSDAACGVRLAGGARGAGGKAVPAGI
jgi:methyltransferase (TIGR00027 family)